MRTMLEGKCSSAGEQSGAEGQRHHTKHKSPHRLRMQPCPAEPAKSLQHTHRIAYIVQPLRSYGQNSIVLPA